MSICDHFGNASLTFAGERGFCKLRTCYLGDNAANARPRGMRFSRIDWISHDRTLRLICAQRRALCGRRGSRCACSTRAPQRAKPRSRAHLHQRGSAPSGPLSQAHPVHELVHEGGRCDAPRGDRGACGGELSRRRRLLPFLAHRRRLRVRADAGDDASLARDQRRAYGGVLPARGPGDQIRDDGGRADEHPPGDSSHRRCGGRCARARCRLHRAQRGQPRHGGRLGRPDGDRYRVRAGNLGASRQPRAERGARVLEHLGRRRRYHRDHRHRGVLRAGAVFAVAWLCGGRLLRAVAHEQAPRVLAVCVSAGGGRVVVLRVHVGRALDHRRRTARVCDSLRLACEREELHPLVGRARRRGEERLQRARTRYRAGGLPEDGLLAGARVEAGRASGDAFGASALPLGVLRDPAPVRAYERERRACGQ